MCCSDTSERFQPSLSLLFGLRKYEKRLNAGRSCQLPNIFPRKFPLPPCLLSSAGTSLFSSLLFQHARLPLFFFCRKLEIRLLASVRHFNRAIECLILSLIWLTSGLQSRACKTRERIVSWRTSKVYCGKFRKWRKPVRKKKKEKLHCVTYMFQILRED